MTKYAYKISDWIGYLSRDDVDLLVDCARRLPANPVVINIGAGTGTSGLAFMESRNDLILYSVDVNDFPNPYGGFVNESNAFRDAGLLGQERHHQLLGDSKLVGKDWAGGAVDMVFVDGLHTVAQVEGDINGWLPHIKDGGIIAFHDFYNAQYLGIAETAKRYFPEADFIGSSKNTAAFWVRKSVL